MIIKYGFVPIQRSSNHPNPPPTNTAPTKTKGSSMAMANWRPKFGSGRFGGAVGGELGWSASKGAKRQEKRIASQADKRLGVDTRHQRNENSYRQRHSLRRRGDRSHRVGGLAHPGVLDDSEIVVHRGDDVEHS